MGKSLRFSRHILLAIFVASTFFQSCKDDVFNAEKVKATYQDKFPVKDIDPNMDWKTTRQVAVDVSVFEDAGVDYTVRIYDADPLYQSNDAHLLAEGTASNSLTFNTVMDCPSIQTEVYVCREDPAGRNIMKLVPIENEAVRTTFGIPASTTRSAKAARSKVSVTTSTPKKTESEIKALLSNAVELTPSTRLKSGQVYKISKGEIYQAELKNDGIWNGNPPAILIIEGNWTPKGNNMNVGNGTDIYILNGGEIVIPKNKTLAFSANDGYLAVFPGGTVTGEMPNGGSELKLSHINETASYYHYNAGTIKNLDLLQVEGYGNKAFYNCGLMENIGTFKCSRFINHGHATFSQIQSANGGGALIENACWLKSGVFNGSLTLGDASRTEIANYNNTTQGEWGATINLGANAALLLGQTVLSARTFTGPANTGKEYALVKIEKVMALTQGFVTSGNIYYEIKEYLSNNDNWKEQFLLPLSNSTGVISKWGESPITIPQGECTGDGNTPSDGSGTSANPIKYTYAFEDNFPLVGDYDFNDIVLDVSFFYKRDSKTNKIKEMQIDVTLAATGAGKTLGAGLRLANVNKNIVDEIEVAGDYKRFEQTLGSDNLFFRNIDEHQEQDDNNIVIPLFGNAHKVYENAEAGSMVNTLPGGQTKKTYTYEIIIEFEDETVAPQITKDNLDFFICYKYKTMEKRMEVHLYEFWKYGPTAAGTIQQTNLDLAGNNTWAICVPNFRYPKEYINISNQADNSDCAYPEFLNWARDRNTCQDWYLHPNKENVYR